MKGENEMSKKLKLFKKEKGVRYILVAGQYIPDVVEPMPGNVWGKFMRARARFLLNHRRDIFFRLKMEGKILEHLNWIEDEAAEMIHNIMERMLEADPIPQSLKNTDLLQWVGLMNNYRSSAEEIVMNDLVYSEGLLDEMEDEMEEIPDFDIDEVFLDYLVDAQEE